MSRRIGDSGIVTARRLRGNGPAGRGVHSVAASCLEELFIHAPTSE